MNPLNHLGHPLNPKHNLGDNLSGLELSKLSRRSFMLMAAALTSCAAAPPLEEKKKIASPTPIKTKKSDYKTPAVKGPVPRNPDQHLTTDFSHTADITFTHVPVTSKYIAMTFDDGPHPKNTPRLLDMLRQRNIKATFFVIGRSVNLYPDVIRRTVAEGHEIGNHTMTHRSLSKLSDDEVRSEIRRCTDAIGVATGIQPRTLRPPYGALLQRQRAMVHDEFGYPTILWSVDPLDWKNRVPSLVSSRILAGAKPGAIILSHDLHSTTVDAMPDTLDALLSRGYQFVTISQLIAMQVDATAQAAQGSANS
ncbi:polysaccharide deacetylase family protein [Luteolibacter pohnpeiensis]|uniref:Polysaccharide deacetylase family protein n=1 Tax=Luteolibacter pohnpeiensis TaxID=454153 RepID=A0A934S3N6_9BACT|nr:polysaccharide deacetylase family protein [Luteolibacter pohnpeiensis]MBK1882580.1 polysaccharide deacetylase family protein [Luteolibacter pohnpeiensis]